jgi:uncharacterized protein (TIGR00296 family)
MKKLSLSEGKELIGLARKSIKYFFASGKVLREIAPKKFSEKQGVFVSLHEFSGELRGCIGFTTPTMPLWNAVIEAAVSAAFNDFRFNPLKLEELEEILIEVSVLTVPEEIKGEKEKIPEKIEIGEDGLIVKMNGNSGLLLPQVAVEWKWNPEEFLEQTCVKAGLEKNSWKEKTCKIFKFQGQIFKEKKPNNKGKKARK